MSTTPLTPAVPPKTYDWLRAFKPAPLAVNSRERLRVTVGAFLGILVTAVLCHVLGLSAQATWIVAPMGASAVLVFGVPASPLAQPWAVLAGNTVSALVGIACARWIGNVDLAAALAVGLAIGLMFLLRCLHPPGGASALLMVMAGVTDPHAALAPVLLNSIVLVAMGLAWNNATGRRYPHPQSSAAAGATSATEHDLDAVLARYNQILDVPRDDLLALVGQTRLAGYQRMLAQTRCADVMSKNLVTVSFGTSLQDAWHLLRDKHIKALPVVDRVNRIVGILTLADFLNAADLDLHQGFEAKLKNLIRWSSTVNSAKPEVVGQIMTRRVRVAGADKPLVDLVPLFGSTGHHHIPIVDPDQRLVGILTQSDLVAAVFKAEREEAAANGR
ncbi:HPP family protein [Variovorax sp. OV329]|uniref:HPP family protein n=1 Tax=Variovorax sp. OV329 TaxID=1882825 RepID=UPI0008F1359D|nr:HPP family protein [Variovorax sp. OV329]SFN12323.1 CBS domain-containing membrane protein [Variovorax sp. OV329]